MIQRRTRKVSRKSREDVNFKIKKREREVTQRVRRHDAPETAEQTEH